MDSLGSENSSIHLSPLKLSSFDDSDLEIQDCTGASVSQLSESLFKFVTPLKKVQAVQSVNDSRSQAAVNLNGKFEALAKIDGSAEISGSKISETQPKDSELSQVDSSAVTQRKESDFNRQSDIINQPVQTVGTASEVANLESVGASCTLAVDRNVQVVSDSENRSKVSSVAEDELAVMSERTNPPFAATSLSENTVRKICRNLPDIEKDLHELRQFHDSLTGRGLQSTMTSKLKTPQLAKLGYNNLSELKSISEQIDFDEEKDKREHYETLSVKLQGRVLELEEQLALSNASNIRKDRTIQELRQKVQTVLKKLDEVSKETVKQNEVLQEERDILEAQVTTEKEKSRELEIRFKEVLKIAENLKEKYHETESLSRTLNLELTDLRTTHKALQRDCTILDEENRRLLNSLNDTQHDFVKIKVEKEKLGCQLEEKTNNLKTLVEEVSSLKVKLEEVKTKLTETEKELFMTKDENRELKSHLDSVNCEKEEQKRRFESNEMALQQKSKMVEEEAQRKIEECRADCNQRINQLRSYLAEESEIKLQSLIVSFEEQLNQLKQKKAEETATLKAQTLNELSQYKSQLAERDAQMAKMKQYNTYLADHCKSMMQFQLMYFNASNSRDMEGVTAMPTMNQFHSSVFPTKSDWKSDGKLKTGFDEFVFNLDKAQRFEPQQDKAVCVSSLQNSDDRYSVGEDSSGTVISSFNASSVKIYYPPVREQTSASKPELKGLVEQVLRKQTSVSMPTGPSMPSKSVGRTSAPDSTRRKPNLITPLVTKKK